MLKSNRAAMRRKIFIMLSVAVGILCIAVIPLAIGNLMRNDVHSDFRVGYLRGLSTVLYWFGADSAASNLDRSAYKIEHDLHPLEICFTDDLESRLIRAEAELICPKMYKWGYESVYYSSGGGLYRFHVPSSELRNFKNSLRAYQDKLNDNRLNGGEGYTLKSVNMNNLLEWLAGIGKMKYFYNSALDDAYYEVTGHMTDATCPVDQINEIAKAFNLKIGVKNDTLFAWCPIDDAGFEMRAVKQLAETQR